MLFRSLATQLTIGRVAMPEMRERGYSPALAAGSCAAGGTLGQLIPPSTAMILYAIMADQSVGKMFVAAVIPGIIGTLLYLATVAGWVWLDPTAAPRGPRFDAAAFARAVRDCWGALLLFGLVLGGLYAGIFTELEAGSVGAVGGDCAGNGQSYQWAGTTLPAYALTMVDGDGQSVVLAPSTAHSYDTGTWRGQTVNQVQITTPGSYRLTVDSTDSGYAVAIGGDPDADASMQQMAGIGAAGAGLVLGLLLIVFGRRKGGATSGGAPVSVPQYAPAQYATGQYPTAPAAPAPPPPPGWGAPQQ